MPPFSLHSCCLPHIQSMGWLRFLMALKKKSKDDVDVITRYSDIPACLVIDILLRLPIETLLACRCAFKDWIPLFSDPSFIRLHLAASAVHMLDPILRNDGVLKFGLVTVDRDTGQLEPGIVNFDTKLNLPRSLHIVNSVNGLLCLVHGTFAKSVYVCNPLLGEWISIPIPVRNHSYLSSAALVFSAKNNQYKVLHCFNKKWSERFKFEKYRFEIYTLDGTRQWRSIDESLGLGTWCKHFERFRMNLIFLHGSLHWTDRWCLGVSGEPFMCCFDVDNEKFRRLLMPRPDNSALDVQLGAINGCLSALYVRHHGGEIWAMKEYGVEKSWTRILIIRRKFILGSPAFMRSRGGLLDPVILFTLSEDEILIEDDCDGFLRYDLKRNRNRRKCFEAYTQWSSKFTTSMTEYKPSFVSLREVAKGEVLLSRSSK